MLSSLGYDEDRVKRLSETQDEEWDMTNELSFVKEYFVAQELPNKEKELRDKLHKEITGKESRELRDLVVKNSGGKISKESAEKLSKAELISNLVSNLSNPNNEEAFAKINELSELLEKKESDFNEVLTKKEQEFISFKQQQELNKLILKSISSKKIDTRFELEDVLDHVNLKAEKLGRKYKVVNNKIELVSAANEDMPIYKDGSKNIRLSFEDHITELIKPFEVKSLGGGFNKDEGNLSDDSKKRTSKINEELARIRQEMKQ